MKKAVLPLVLLGLLFVSVAFAEEKEVSDPKLAEKLKEAEAVQEARQEADPVEAKVIKEAPEATLNAGTGDVSTTGIVPMGFDVSIVLSALRQPPKSMRVSLGFFLLSCVLLKEGVLMSNVDKAWWYLFTVESSCCCCCRVCSCTKFVLAGDCAGDIDNFCDSVKAGVNRLATCLSKQLEEEEKGNVQGDDSTCMQSAHPALA